jgi:hypothetical protein
MDPSDTSEPLLPAERAEPAALPDPPRRRQPGGYIAAHWGGRLPLGQSYWINGAVVSFVSSMVLFAAIHAIDVTHAPTLYFSVVSGAQLSFVALTVWQIVGIWRSANRHPARGGKPVWAGLARISVALSALVLVTTTITRIIPSMRESVQIITGTDRVPRHVLRLLDGGNGLEIAGGIDFGTTDDVHRWLDASPDVTTIHVNNLGGRVAEAHKLATLIRDRKLETYAATECVSACTDLLMAGAKRYISPFARIGFHRFTSPGASPELIRSAIEAEKRTLVDAGVDPAFAERAYSTPSDTLWFPTHEELLAARVIDAVVSVGDTALSGLNSPGAVAAFEKGLLDNSLMAAIKQNEPAAYDELWSKISVAIAQGSKLGDLQGVVRTYASRLIGKYLAVADADALLEMVGVTIDEIRALEADPNSCYALLNPKKAAAPLGATQVPAELTRREMEVGARIIASGATNPQAIPPIEEVQPALTATFARLSAKLGADVRVVSQFNDPAVDKAKLCRVTRELYEEIVAAPREQSVPELRVILAGAK